MDIKQARKLPHLNFSPQEWFFSTRFHSLEARGLLIDLAAIQWMRGGFPNDRTAIERLVGVPVAVSVWDEITPLLVTVESGFGLQWIEDERSAAIDRIETARKSGSTGGKRAQFKGASRHPRGTLEAPSSESARVPQGTLDLYRTGLDCIGLDRTEPENENTSCSLAPTSDAKPSRSKPTDAIRWDLEGGWQGITDADLAAWAIAYPACKLDVQLARADQWLRANPVKAKKSLWRKFLVNWLARSQDSGGDAKSNGIGPTPNGHHPPRQTVEEKSAALADLLRNAPSRRHAQ